MLLGSFTDLYLTYSLVRRLTLAFEDWPAFKKGVIDKDGNILVPKDKRTGDQKDAFRTYDVLILNMKKLLAKIPGGSSKFATYAAALFLIKEPNPINESIDSDFNTFLESLTENDINSIKTLIEDAPANTSGGGSIAGLSGEVAGHAVFDVDDDVIWKSIHGKHPRHKYKKYVGDDETGQQIKEFGKKYPKKGILLRNSRTGQMVFLRRKLR